MKTARLPHAFPSPSPARRPGWRAATLGLAAAALLLSGCESMSERQKGTATGAGIGAVAGAVIGSATGGRAGTGAVVGGAIGAVAGNLWSKRMEDRRRAMEQATQGTGVEVSRTADNQLKLNIPNEVSFDTNSYAIKPAMRGVLDPFAQSLQGDPNVRLSIVGHTDTTGNDAINDPLSVERAQSVRDYLAARGVSPARISTAGRGSREPIADNASEAGRAKNRRVEIYLAEPQA
ncbi:outer membrane lipoprotein omp16 precursor [Piscinibacter sakaiensis]|uniref:Outer membrane lipoprotein omp16 n=2 Tax=Piscinibacter sakaiensis TaxID=1547922 RepID=A0A0K8P2L5_PISS1|nr:outer membrane lipoprotein omp16 precursor [Piscinibacter sakaiensis]